MTDIDSCGRYHRVRRRNGLALAILAVIAMVAGCSSHTSGRSAPSTAASGQTAPTQTSATTAGPVTSSTAASSTTTPACTDASVIASWPTSRKAEQVLVVPILSAGEASVRVALSSQAGGMLLLGQVPSRSQLVSALAPAAGGTEVPKPFVMVDQEGGGVQRLGADVQSIPWPRQMASTMTTVQVQQLAQSLGRQMAALGVGVDLAPVLDLDGGPALSSSDPDGPRSFSTNPSVAAAYGRAFAAGLQSGGVLPVAKHFPGLGGASGNTDYGPASTPSITQLDAAGLVPFEQAVAGGLRAVMVANATVPGLTAMPASLSAPAITGLLRGSLHFNGLVMTDSLSAGAVTAAGYNLTSATVAALEAGADMVLFGSTLTAADTAALAPGPLAAQTQALVGAITKAVGDGKLPAARLDQAVLHVVQAKGADLCRSAGR